ncbi:hypothetical protein [Owenweeksia hongkongensis]|uniref:hypothetical protein n=1 Tax=Owenweeksia hongkongensis TaxID=253245 RepID=UPI003A8E5312
MLLKTNAFFSLALASLFTLPGVAQIDYSLKGFQTPDIHYRRLDANTSLSGNQNNFENSNSTVGVGTLSLDFYGYTNTDKYIGKQYGRANGGFRLLDNENESPTGEVYKNKGGSSNYYLQGTAENRWYTNQRDGGYFGLHGALGYQGGMSKRELTGVSVDLLEEDDQSINGQLYTSYGIGRIEPVTYARLAYDTYDWLRKKDRLSESPSNEDIDQLGAVMTEVANTRFFDSRFKRIFQLEQIDSTLRNSGLITEADMVYFAQVADIWGYANNFERGSGSLWEFGAVGDLAYEDYYYKRTENDSVIRDEKVVGWNDLAVYGYARYINQKPISVKWQRDYDVALYVGTGGHFQEIYNLDTDLNPNFRSTLKAGYQFGYYPNTRTYWTTRINGFVTYGENSDASDEGYGYALEARSQLYYWFTPRFRLSVNLKLVYSDNYVADSFIPLIDDSMVYDSSAGYNGKGFSTSLGASLSYALF